MRRTRKQLPGAREIQRERFQLDHIPPAGPPRESAIAQIIPAIMQRLRLDERAWLTLLRTKWPDLVGAAVAAHAQPGRLDGATLIVFVDSAVWLAELKRFGSRKILTALQGAFGATRIRTLRLVPAPDRPHT